MKLPDGIRTRGNRFTVDVSHRGIRKTGTAATLDEAKNLQAMLKQALTQQVGTEVSSTWTLREALEKTRELAWGDEECLSADKLIRNGERVVDFFGASTPITTITTEKVDGFVSYLLAEGNSNATVNRKLAALSKMLTIAMQRGKLGSKPYMARRKESQGRIRFITQLEEKAILATLDQWGKHDHSEAVCVLIDTGMRPSELWKLEARDLDADLKTISVWQTKTDKPRTVPMTQRVQDILFRRASLHPHKKLFPFDNFWLGQVWDRMKAHIGLDADKQFIPYAMRHTCASRLVQRKVSLLVVKEWLGHTTIITTQRYAHLCPTNLLDAVKVLEAI